MSPASALRNSPAEDCVSVLGAAAAESLEPDDPPKGALLYVEGGERVVGKRGRVGAITLQAAANDERVEATLDPQFASNGLPTCRSCVSRDARQRGDRHRAASLRRRHVWRTGDVVSGITVPGDAPPPSSWATTVSCMWRRRRTSRGGMPTGPRARIRSRGTTPADQAARRRLSPQASTVHLAWRGMPPAKRVWLAGQDAGGIAGRQGGSTHAMAGRRPTATGMRPGRKRRLSNIPRPSCDVDLRRRAWSFPPTRSRPRGRTVPRHNGRPEHLRHSDGGRGGAGGEPTWPSGADAPVAVSSF